jgi:hypothetical protein
MVTSSGQFMERVSPPQPKPPGKPLIKQLYTSLNFIQTFSAVSIKRSAWIESGGLNSNYSVSADYDLYFRLATDYEFQLVDRPLVAKRRHEENTSGDPYALYEDVQRILSEASNRHGFLSKLTLSEKREYGFQRAFCAYHASNEREALHYCFVSILNGFHLLAILLLLVIIINKLTGPLQLGSRGYRFYNALKKIKPRNSIIQSDENKKV